MKWIKNGIASFFISNRAFYILGGIAVLFLLGHFISFAYTIASLALFGLCLLVLVDTILLYASKNTITGSRILPEKLSNGDVNKVSLEIQNSFKIPLRLAIIEELPFQFGNIKNTYSIAFQEAGKKTIRYNIKPTKRGEYHFGNTNLYTNSLLGLVTRKYIVCQAETIRCYPSFVRFNEFNIKAVAKNSALQGSRKIRRLGNSLEFEQIKEYVAGDDIRSLNWKASAKKNQLMVNQYVDEKSQPIYTIIDKGRTMQMPFEGLSLLDYAINATLAISNVALRKQDRAGMLSFSRKVEDVIVAEQRNSQMHMISETLYNVNTDFAESDFSKLYATVKRKIPNRSLFILFTNFETMDGLHRQLPYLRAIAKSHLLLVVFFKNTLLEDIGKSNPENLKQVYDKIIAENFIFDKKQIVSELKKYGIMALLTSPEHLTTDTISRYLDLKGNGQF